MRTTPLLAALLMLGGVSGAYAQEGPSEGSLGASERGSSAAQERGSGRDAGVSNRSEAGEQSRWSERQERRQPQGPLGGESGSSQTRRAPPAALRTTRMARNVEVHGQVGL